MKSMIRILSCIVIFQLCWIIYICMNPRTEIIVQTKTETVEIEKIVEVEVPVEVEPTYIHNITSEEREMLARLVYLEARGESLDCQKAIISVVINRWQHGYWGDTLKEVVYAENQFTPAPVIKNTTPKEEQYEAVDYVLKYGCTLPKYVVYFRADYDHQWDDYIPYTVIDSTYFGYAEKYMD